MTVPQVRALLVHLLEVRVWDAAEILWWPVASRAQPSRGHKPPQATSRRAAAAPAK